MSILLAFTLMITLFVPQLTSAYTEIGNADDPLLTIHKFEQEPGTDEGEAGTGLPGQEAEGDAVEGVEFTLTQTHAFNPGTNEWTEVSNADPIIGTTGENGQIVFTQENDLELGRYTVEETDGPEHIILNDEVFTVDIPMTSEDGTTLNYDVHIYPKNEIVRGDAELIKVDEDGNTLEGVVFGLYNDADDLIDTLTTNDEGKINVEGLAQGNYYFQEISTVEGQALNTTKINFEVVAGEVNTIAWTPIDGFVDENGEVINYKKPEIGKDVEGSTEHSVDRDAEYKYNITLTTPGDIKNYSALGTWDTLDERLSFVSDGTITDGWDVTGTTKDNITFTQNGQTLNWDVINLELLEPGIDIVITFTAKINPDAELNEGETGIENTAEIEFDNDNGQSNDPNDDPEEPPTPPVIVDPTEGGLQIIKVDKSDNDIRLQGAEFKLTTDEAGDNVVDASGTVITVDGESYDGLLENLATNSDGEIIIEGLTPGTYYLHETKAPIYTEDGVEKPYRLLTAPLTVEVADDIEASEILVENSKSGWELPTTGGIGTILFTLVGVALMAIAAIAFLRRRNQPVA